MANNPIAQANVGDYHFELHKEEGGRHKVLRSDISDPARIPEEVAEVQELPPQIFSIFKNCMW